MLGHGRERKIISALSKEADTCGKTDGIPIIDSEVYPGGWLGAIAVWSFGSLWTRAAASKLPENSVYISPLHHHHHHHHHSQVVNIQIYHCRLSSSMERIRLPYLVRPLVRLGDRWSGFGEVLSQKKNKCVAGTRRNGAAISSPPPIPKNAKTFSDWTLHSPTSPSTINH